MDQISFRTAQAASATQPKQKEMPSEQKNGNNNQVENGDKKIALTLGGLAALGLAALAFKTGKGHKAKEVLTEAAQQLPKAADDVTEKVAKEAAEHAKAHAMNVAQKAADEKAAKLSAELASKALENPTVNYAKTKKITKLNLTHEGKEVVNKALKDGLGNRRTQEAAIKKATTEAMETAKKGATKANTASIGMKNASNGDIVQKVLDSATGAEKAKQAANEMAEIAKANPTRKNIKRATFANNQALKAEKGYEHVIEGARKNVAKQDADAAKKAANIAKQQASPHYEDGLSKQKINAEKTSANKQANLLKKEKARPAWKNAENRLSKLSPEQLKAVIANPKSSNVEVKVAKHLLGL